MRNYLAPLLFLFLALPSTAQNTPKDWKVIKDAKGACQIAVPPDWSAMGETNGAAILHEAGTAIAVVTSQPGQEFKPLPASLVKSLDLKEKMFDNTAKRIFYQDRTSTNAEEGNAFSASVPGKDGTCSCHVVALPSVPADVAKKIAGTLGPAPDKN